MTTSSVTATQTVASLTKSQAADLIRQLAYYMAKEEEIVIRAVTGGWIGGPKMFITVEQGTNIPATLLGQEIAGELMYLGMGIGEPE